MPGNPNLKESKFKRAIALPFRSLIKWISPTLFVKLQYFYITHHWPNLKEPVRYTEKLQYLRLFVYPNDDLVIKCSDREAVRDYVNERGFNNILIPIYGVYENFNEIDFVRLPNTFVLKATHACAFNKLVFDKSTTDLIPLKKKFVKWLETDYGKQTVERHYSKIKPQIIIEKLLLENQNLPIEYKIHVFNGVAKYMYVVTGRGENIRYNNYYIDWTPFDGAQFNGWKKSEEEIDMPKNWDEMVRIAESLAQPFPFVRVDLYSINGKIYFNELTFTPAKGTLIFDDDQADFEIGEWLDISTLMLKDKK